MEHISTLGTSNFWSNRPSRGKLYTLTGNIIELNIQSSVLDSELGYVFNQDPTNSVRLACYALEYHYTIEDIKRGLPSKSSYGPFLKRLFYQLCKIDAIFFLNNIKLRFLSDIFPNYEACCVKIENSGWSLFVDYKEFYNNGVFQRQEIRTWTGDETCWQYPYIVPVVNHPVYHYPNNEICQDYTNCQTVVNQNEQNVYPTGNNFVQQELIKPPPTQEPGKFLGVFAQQFSDHQCQ
jgi:hypothetical protein